MPPPPPVCPPGSAPPVVCEMPLGPEAALEAHEGGRVPPPPPVCPPGSALPRCAGLAFIFAGWGADGLERRRIVWRLEPGLPRPRPVRGVVPGRPAAPPRVEGATQPGSSHPAAPRGIDGAAQPDRTHPGGPPTPLSQGRAGAPVDAAQPDRSHPWDPPAPHSQGRAGAALGARAAAAVTGAVRVVEWAREACAAMGRWVHRRVLGREGGQAGAPAGAQAAPAQPQAALAPVHVPCAPGGSGATQVRPPDLTPKRGWTPSS